MYKDLLFTRKFQGEVYTFYYNYGIGPFGIDSSYYSVETPCNSFGYNDTILFTESDNTPYTLWRHCPNWILTECKKALLKKGYIFSFI